MKCNVQNEHEKYKSKLRLNINPRARRKLQKNDVYRHIHNYLSAPENTNLDIMFDRALENIKRKNGDI